MTKSRITRYLAQANDLTFAIYAIFASFSTYFCVYAFRKPFAVGTFEGAVALPWLPPLDYKIVLIIAQVLGYCVSKFLGIKIVSEMSPARRAGAILALLGSAHLALLLFALTPPPYAAIFLFVNGLPLGTVWGLVFGFLEGRKLSEVLGAGLSASFIVASGFVKTVGRWLLDMGLDERWMPFATGAAFFPFLLLFVWMLSRLPPPSREDESLRTKRVPMSAAMRRRFFFTYTPGLLLLTFLYVFLTAFRDFRDNFARELWDALGYGDAPSVLTASEIPIAVGVLLVLASVMWVRNNRRALMLIHGIMLAGTALIGLSTLAHQVGWLSPIAWMILVGLGLYVAYVPFGCVLFDRLIAAVGFIGTSGFMIYVTDAFGYLGSVFLLLYKNFAQPNLSWLNFFVGFAYTTSVLCSFCYIASLIYFRRTTATTMMAGPTTMPSAMAAIVPLPTPSGPQDSSVAAGDNKSPRRAQHSH